MANESQTQLVHAQVERALQEGIPPSDIYLFTEYLRHAVAQPANYDFVYMARILLSTLLHIEDSYRVACLCLIPEAYHDKPEIREVLMLEDRISRGDYAGFWTHFNSTVPSEVRAAWNTSPKFTEAMRRAMAQSLPNTFLTVDAVQLAKMLGCASPIELTRVVECLAESTAGGIVKFQPNEFNRPKSPPPPRDLTSENIAQLLRNVLVA